MSLNILLILEWLLDHPPRGQSLSVGYIERLHPKRERGAFLKLVKGKENWVHQRVHQNVLQSKRDDS